MLKMAYLVTNIELLAYAQKCNEEYPSNPLFFPIKFD